MTHQVAKDSVAVALLQVSNDMQGFVRRFHWLRERVDTWRLLTSRVLRPTFFSWKQATGLMERCAWRRETLRASPSVDRSMSTCKIAAQSKSSNSHLMDDDGGGSQVRNSGFRVRMYCFSQHS